MESLFETLDGAIPNGDSYAQTAIDLKSTFFDFFVLIFKISVSA